ncbi:MAG: hypothetical protein LBU18_01475 [Treponema sp.]|jgi:hypothetical protein|nr:hypothetical protein [Treponema sp.]
MKHKKNYGPLCVFMRMGLLIEALIFGLPCVSVFSQEIETGEASSAALSPIEAENGDAVIPDVVRRPARGEDPRYPRDAVIGELGRGLAQASAYGFARELLSAFLGGTTDQTALAGVNAALKEEINGTLQEIDAGKYRIGGGREEDDGATSFLFRFIGREKGAAGELYLRREEESWQLDDIILEEPRDNLSAGEAYPYDFTPYERFF